MSNRPTGVTILAILSILGGLSNLSSVATYGTVGILFALLGILQFVIAYGLWELKPWARMAAIIVQIISIISFLGVYAYFEAVFPGFGLILLLAAIPSILISVIIILYLNKQSVKDAFEGTGQAEDW